VLGATLSAVEGSGSGRRTKDPTNDQRLTTAARRPRPLDNQNRFIHSIETWGRRRND
jgi:hypothetical protein